MEEDKIMTSEAHDAASTITWDWKARHILTDKFVLLDMVRILLFAGGGLTLILVSIILFKGDKDALPSVLLFCAVILGGVALLFILVMLVVGGMLRYRFTVDEKGVTFEMLSKSVSKLNWLTIFAGAMARNPGVTGAGLLAKAEEYNRIGFEGLTKVRYYPKDNVIFIRGRYNPKPIRLYCLPERYEEIAARISNGFKLAKQARAEDVHLHGPSAIPKRLKWSLAGLLACALLFASPVKIQPVLILTLCVVLLGAIWVTPANRFFGVLVSLFSLGLLVFVGYEGTLRRLTTTAEEFIASAKRQGVHMDHVPESLLGPHTIFGRLDPDEWFGLVICVLGCLMAIWIGIKAFNGAFERRRPK